ncbi:MAG: phytanoyl-CoA dioxygenase family protein [Bacteroidia bacterium]|nr:phytanoyl-CoA dioxygenase family protein [Bacteroidia bacterium]
MSLLAFSYFCPSNPTDPLKAIPVLVHDNHQQVLDQQGFVSFPFLQSPEIKALLNAKQELDVKDTNTYKISQTLDYSLDFNAAVQNVIYQTVNERIRQHFKDFRLISARFVVKRPSSETFIPPHQDRLATDEEEGEFPTYTIWIPLKEVDLSNGTLGLLPKSHLSYTEYPAPYPDPRIPRFCDSTIFDLFPYQEYLNFQAGEAVVFNVRTFHGSLPNFSNTERLAVKLEICHQDATLVNFYMKPGTGNRIMLKMKVDEDFFARYPNERLLEMYDRNEVPPYEVLEELPYRLMDADIPEFVKQTTELEEKIKPIFLNRVDWMVKNKSYISEWKYNLIRLLPF